jgi:hypothetical protein
MQSADEVDPWVPPFGGVNFEAGESFDPVVQWVASEEVARGMVCVLPFDVVTPWRAVGQASSSASSCAFVACVPACDATPAAGSPARKSLVLSGAKKGQFAASCAKLAKGKQRLALAQQKEKWICFWVDVVCEQLAGSSALEGRAERHVRAAFVGLEASTLGRHVPGWKRWTVYCADLQVGPGSVTPVVLADFCALLCPEDPEGEQADCSGAGAVRSSLAAISFVANHAHVTGLVAALCDPSVLGYKKSCVLRLSERKLHPFRCWQFLRWRRW